MCVTTESSSFQPRITAPSTDNKYYYSDNVFYNSGYGIPNCTAYVWGRAYELLGEKPKLCLGDAGAWFDYNKENSVYSYGNEPKLGAIACFDNSYGGHVAVVEEIKNKTITFSNSAYEGEAFYLSTASIDDEYAGNKQWTFQGYIYILDDRDNEIVTNNFAENLYCRYRVTASDGLNFREKPTAKSNSITVIPCGGEFYISEIKATDNYTWALACYNGKIGYCAIDFAQLV